MEIKSIKGKKEFVANGNKYIILDKLTTARWIEYEKLQPLVTYGVTFKQLDTNHRKAFDFLNKQKFADAAVIMHNIMNGVINATDEKRIHPVLLMCSLFMVREDEDVKIFDEKYMEEKILDWHAEGIDMMDFFQFALSSIHGFRETLLKSTESQIQSISEDLNKTK